MGPERLDASSVPVLVVFLAGSRITRGKPVSNSLPIVQNGPPGTFVHFPGGRGVPVPTDQVVFCDDEGGAARVGFGGMRFDGVEDDLLSFRRVQDLLPEEYLSPERGFHMTFEPETVAAVFVHGRRVWPSS
ncbi:MAG: hypothetical protein ACAI25_18020 [Planctomycetota bacterium]